MLALLGPEAGGRRVVLGRPQVALGQGAHGEQRLGASQPVARQVGVGIGRDEVALGGDQLGRPHAQDRLAGRHQFIGRDLDRLDQAGDRRRHDLQLAGRHGDGAGEGQVGGAAFALDLGELDAAGPQGALVERQVDRSGRAGEGLGGHREQENERERARRQGGAEGVELHDR